MRTTLSKLLASSIVALMGAAAQALAQNISNEAWIGQVGGVNALDIVQQGRANSAGADNIFLLLSQNGTGNRLSLDQFGYANKIGTLFGNDTDYARGVWQNGDINVIDVRQHNAGPGGSNTIGAIQQDSAFNLLVDGANQLRVIQTELGGLDGTAGHYIGRLVQANAQAGAGAARDNLAAIIQRGGGAGVGNVMANLYQQGSGNAFRLLQSDQSNQLGESRYFGGVWQIGQGNRAGLVQDGDGNLIENLRQSGDGNLVRTRLSGTGNAISYIEQNSEGFGADGNRMEVTISGEYNGGSGALPANVGEFLWPQTLHFAGVAQGVFTQLGGDNSIRLTITGGSESKYGLTQDGDGNQAAVSIASPMSALGQLVRGNETAIYQKGSLNVANQTVLGNQNAGAMTQDGRRNRVDLVQTGDRNVALVTIKGDDNNNDNTAHGPTLFGTALDVASLQPGDIAQLGNGNIVTMAVIGSSNGFTLAQSGPDNRIDASMTGRGNALAVVQEAGLNISLSAQTGNSNALRVHQY